MEIKFICGDRHVAKHFPPKPASKERPDWYNKMPGWLGDAQSSPPTLKKCMPVYDHMTSGYIVYNPVEQEITCGGRMDNDEIVAFERRFPRAWHKQDPQEGHMHACDKPALHARFFCEEHTRAAFPCYEVKEGREHIPNNQMTNEDTRLAYYSLPDKMIWLDNGGHPCAITTRPQNQEAQTSSYSSPGPYTRRGV